MSKIWSFPSEYTSLPEKSEVQNQLNLLREEAALSKKVQILGKNIVSANGLSDKYHFHVYQSKQNEVLHAANNTLFLPTGLLKLAKTDANIAFILAHEIAHWENKDYQTNQARIPSSPGDIKESECNADESGILLYKNAGYSMKALNAFFINMLPYRPHQESCPDVYELEMKK